jgi:hypothetical protein
VCVCVVVWVCVVCVCGVVCVCVWCVCVWCVCVCVCVSNINPRPLQPRAITQVGLTAVLGRFAEDKIFLVPTGIRTPDRLDCKCGTKYTRILLTKPKRLAKFPPLQPDDNRYAFRNAVTAKYPSRRPAYQITLTKPSTTTNCITFVNTWQMFRPY